MILDVTGSMDDEDEVPSKLDNLKEAATEALGIFLGRPRVRVALVPYAQGVRVDGLLKDTIFDERQYGMGDPPGMYDTKPRSIGSAYGDGCSTERRGDQQFTDAGPAVAMVNRSADLRKDACPDEAVTPLSNDIDKLTESIDRFSAGGSTAGQIGIQWGWYLLSENWADVLPTSARPERMDRTKVRKFVLLMTDGEFNLAYTTIPKGSSKKKVSSEHAVDLCKAMRMKGIEIFTVGFKLDDSSAKKTMRDCATPDVGAMKYYYSASTGDELMDTFRTIANSMQKLALTK
jgi:hypothetical protein